MNDKVLKKFTSDYLAQQFAFNLFAWQGGEPLLMGLDFYRKAIELQNKYRRDNQKIENTMQTNATLLDDGYCNFFSGNNFLLGISLDGPKQFHDYYRINRLGRGSFDRVMAGIELCRKYKTQFNILILLNDKNVIAPDELFDFFIENKFKSLQFIPCVEKDPTTGEIADYSITPKQLGDFLCRIFDRWLEYGPERLTIRLFDSMLSYYVLGHQTLCIFGNKCDGYVVVEHNGDVFCCDFFVEKNWKIGNLLDTPIGNLVKAPLKLKFAAYKRPDNNKCLVCTHRSICNGGCPKDRVVVNLDHRAPSYFCQSYKQFFDYSRPIFMQLAAKIIKSRTLKGIQK